MLAANVWYWWIGVVLLIVVIAAVAGLVASYVKSVASQNYPDTKQSRQSDL